MFDQEGNFTLKPDEYRVNDDGSLTVFKGNRLNIYKTEVKNNVDYSVEFKSMYTLEDGTFYTISAGYVIIPPEFKNRDDDGNLIISSDFFGEDCPFTLSESGMTIPKGYYQLKEKVIQPQSAMVIMDYKTGAIKGSSSTGQQARGSRVPPSSQWLFTLLLFRDPLIWLITTPWTLASPCGPLLPLSMMRPLF